jgi:hypothetical protein
MDQAGINGKAMAANKAFRNAARNGGLKHSTEKIAVTEFTVHCLTGDCKAICREGRYFEKVL